MLRKTAFATLLAVLFCAAPALANDFYARPALPTASERAANSVSKQTDKKSMPVPASWKNPKVPGRIVKSTRSDGKRPAPASIQ